MSEAPIDRAVFDELKNMVGEDYVGEIIDTYLDDAPQLIAQLDESLSASKVEDFRRAAHSLKSNSASFGAHDLSEKAKELEFLARDEKLHDVGDKIDGLKNTYGAVERYLKEIRPQYD